jgi:hypothetical protein
LGQPKKIAFELIEREPETEPYRILREVRRDYHPDTAEARIALAWRKGYKPDPEGHIVLGQCVKASDLQREFVDLDFIILLNKEIWRDLQFTADMKKALIDHEMSHAAMAYDSEGEPKIDEKNRRVWRIRAHDVSEFIDVVRRNGTWKRDLQMFAESLVKKKNPVFPELELPADPTLIELTADLIPEGEEFDPELDTPEEPEWEEEPKGKSGPKELKAFHESEGAKEEKKRGRPKKLVPEPVEEDELQPF